MNKIVIVGHPASGHEEVLALLQECGMTAALPSRREGLLPQAITTTLCKAYKVPPLDDVIDEQDYAQIEAAPVWQGMALDLMLGNLEQPLWGWADPQAIFALDYWASLDPQLTFVLVYDEPHRVLMQAGRGEGNDLPSSAPSLQHGLDNWAAYNGALLRFHLRNPARSLLVHAGQVGRATDRYLEQLQPLLGAPLLAAPTADASSDAPALPAQMLAQGDLPTAIAAALPQPLVPALNALGVDVQEAAALFAAEPAERYLVDDVLAQYPAVLQLYAELQSVANLPLNADARAPEGAANAAWEALQRQRNFVAELMLRMHGEANRASDEAARRLAELETERVERSRAQVAMEAQARTAKTHADGLEAKTVSQAERLRQLSDDNEMLLSQLHRVQEELERYYLQSNDLATAKNAAQKENALLLAQVRKVQEELDRGYLQLQEMDRTRLASDKALAAARHETDALKYQLGLVRAELQAQVERAPELSIVPSRRLASTLLRRLLRKVVPAGIWNSRVRSKARARLAAELAQIRKSEWFDAQWYLATYPDVRKAGLDAAEHYHLHGWCEGRKPGPRFDTEHYLTIYPDVRLSGVDPLLHFIRHGAGENRLPSAEKPVPASLPAA